MAEKISEAENKEKPNASETSKPTRTVDLKTTSALGRAALRK